MRTCSSPSNTNESYWEPRASYASGRSKFFRGTHDATHHFVGHDKEVVLLGDSSDLLELVPAEHLSDGVVRGVDDDHLRPRRNSSSGR